MAAVQPLEGFLGARWKHRAYAAVLVRRTDGAVLTVKDTTGVHESAYGEDSEPDWVLPTAQVRPGMAPRGAASAVLARMALEPAMGRMLVHDFRPASGGKHSAQDGGTGAGTEFFVYDGGTWVTGVERFTADGGLLQVRFCPLDQLEDLLPASDALRAAAGVRALELGGVAELEHGLDVTPRNVPGNRQPPRDLMPQLPMTATVPGLRRPRG